METLEIVAALVVALGGFFCLVAGLGITRMPDVYIRMHAATKAGTLGVGLIALALVLLAPSAWIAAKAALCAVFMIMTAPIGAHLIGRAAFRTRAPMWDRTVVDPECDSFLIDERQHYMGPKGVLEVPDQPEAEPERG